MELITVLAQVGCLGRSHRSTPQGALVVGETRRIGASDGVGVDGWIAFNIHIEGDTTSRLFAEGRTSQSIKAF